MTVFRLVSNTFHSCSFCSGSSCFCVFNDDAVLWLDLQFLCSEEEDIRSRFAVCDFCSRDNCVEIILDPEFFSY